MTIYHNPKCSTSRKVLDRIRAQGIEPVVVEYLKTPPSSAELMALVGRMGLRLRDILRRKGTPYDELGLDDPKISDTQILAHIAAHPVLIERPIVATPKGARICRPVESVDGVL